ncbi:MAG TPA: alpha/beta hydrolase [Devosia sp.]|nr:alpha/beta hydrolase [Devosia sp.]
MGLPPLVLIHGMWSRPDVWENYRVVFEGAGFETHVPALRFHDVEPHGPEPEGIGTVSLVDYADDLQSLIEGLDEKPVLVGHSMGGLLALMLVARGLARAGVLLTPAPGAGVLVLQPSAIRVFLRTLLTWGFWRKGTFPTYKEVRQGILNNVSEVEARDLYGQMVWESGRATFEIANWFLDFKRGSAVPYGDIDMPLLIIGAAKDRITPVSVVGAMAKRLSHTATFEVLPDNAHWVLGEKGWEKIAERCVEWIKQTVA